MLHPGSQKTDSGFSCLQGAIWTLPLTTTHHHPDPWAQDDARMDGARVPAPRPTGLTRARCSLCVLPSPQLERGRLHPPSGPRGAYHRGRAGVAAGLAAAGSGRRRGLGRSPRPRRRRSPAAAAAKLQPRKEKKVSLIASPAKYQRSIQPQEGWLWLTRSQLKLFKEEHIQA